MRTVGEVAVQQIEHHEISHGAAGFAGLSDTMTRTWNGLVKDADPNDATVGARFMESAVEPELEKFKQGFITEGGQKFAEARVEALRTHLFQKTAADMSTLAADAVEVNHRQTVNGLSNTVHDDPSSLDYSLKTLEASTGALVGSSPNLTGTAAAGVQTKLMQSGKEAIVKSAVLGAIEKNPDAGLKLAEDPRYSPYITGAEVKQFATYAKAQQRSQQLTEKQLALYEKQQATDAAHQALSKNWTESVSFDENGKPTIKPDFYKNVMGIESKYPGLMTERARSMINWGQSQQRERREVVTTDQGVRTDLYDGLFQVNNPTSDVDIRNAAAQDKLSPYDTSTLMALHRALEDAPLKEPVFKASLMGAKSLLGTDPIGLGKYADFVQEFAPTYQAMKRAGTLPANALNLKDPSSMISQAMKPYQRAPMDIIRDKFLRGMELTPQEGSPTKFTPPPSWQYSPSRSQYRDPKTNKLYDLTGKEVQ